MTFANYELDTHSSAKVPLGLIVLKTDETLEPDFRRYFPDGDHPIFVSRIPSGKEVTTSMLSGMKAELETAASLLPEIGEYPVVGYGCTSASAVIGSEAVAQMVQNTCKAKEVTNPLRATVAQARHLGVSKFALVSPYIEEVNNPLRAAFAQNGLSTDVFKTFGISEDSKVAKVTTESVCATGIELGQNPEVEAVFLSCTNLRTIEAIPMIEKAIGKPVLSSNQSLAWHMRALAEGADW